MMDEDERRYAELMRDRLKKVLPELKLAFENAKKLSDKYDWGISYIDMCEAYMILADAYIGVVDVLNEEA